MTTTLCGSQKISYYTNSNEWGEVQRNTKNNEYLSTKISNSQTLELRYKCLHWMISGVYTWGQNLSSNCGYHYLEHYGGWKQYTLNLPICKIWSQQTSKSNMEYTSHMSNKDCTLKTYVHNGKKNAQVDQFYKWKPEDVNMSPGSQPVIPPKNLSGDLVALLSSHHSKWPNSVDLLSDLILGWILQ